MRNYNFILIILAFVLFSSNKGNSQGYASFQVEAGVALSFPFGDKSLVGPFSQPVDVFAQSSLGIGGHIGGYLNPSNRVSIGLNVSVFSMDASALSAKMSWANAGAEFRYHLIPLSSRLSPFIAVGGGLSLLGLSQSATNITPTGAPESGSLVPSSLVRSASDYSLGSAVSFHGGLGAILSLNDQLGVIAAVRYHSVGTSTNEALQKVYPTHNAGSSFVSLSAAVVLKLARKR